MKRLAVLLSLAFLSPAVAQADGCPASTCGTASSGEAIPGSSLFVVRPSGPQGPLVAYDSATGMERFRLPQGRLSADGRSFFSSATARNRTVIGSYGVRDGRFLRSWSIWKRATLSAVSAHGRWLALTMPARRAVTFALFDARRGAVAQRVTLRGTYEAEALSSDGRRLFLIHWRSNGYDLRTYDFATRRLYATRLAEPDEKMSGIALNAIASRDGRWLFTLYFMGQGMGFVHALDLRTGIAHCVDLPWHGSDATQYGAAALALSPDGSRLYLANPVLGWLAVVDLRTLQVRRNVRFVPLTMSGFTEGTAPLAAVTPNGRMLAFSGGRNVWLYDIAYGVTRGPFAAAPTNYGIQIAVTGLGITPDGRRVLALRADDELELLDAATGRRASIAPSLSDTFAVRAGVTGPLVGYDTRTPQPRFLLPDGRASADGTRYFAAIARSAHTTAIETYAPSSGELQRVDLISGRWNLGAVSASGETIALSRHAQRTTWVEVLDVSTMRTLHARALHGVYTLDAVTDDGKRLFLIRHFRNGTYSVQALDFVRNRLWTATLREKGVEESPVMTGLASGQVASQDGRWLLTLYLNTSEQKAFVHALNLRAAYAVCIDLPSGSRELPLLRDYSLSLAPDGDVYAANPALGVVARIDLRKASVTDRLRFAASSPSGGWAASAVSHNGRMLYFASGRRVWGLDTAFRIVRGPYAAGGAVVGLAFSRDGRKVFAARSNGGVLAFDAARGTVLKA